VIVAVAVMLEVEMPIDDVAGVVAVRDGLVATAWAVNVVGGVRGTGVAVRATRRVGVADRQRVLLNLPIRGQMVEVAVVDVINMVTVTDRSVAALRAMLMVVVVVDSATHSSSSEIGFEAGRFNSSA